MDDREAEEYIAISMNNAVCLAAAARMDLDQGMVQGGVIARVMQTIRNGGPGFALQYGACATVELAHRLSDAEVLAHPLECHHPYPDGDDDREHIHDRDHVTGEHSDTETIFISSAPLGAPERAEKDQAIATNIDSVLEVLPRFRDLAARLDSDGVTFHHLRNSSLLQFATTGNAVDMLTTEVATTMLMLTKIPDHVLEFYLKGDPDGKLPQI